MADSRISVAVLLSGREQFSPYFGGALARWTYEVYSRLQQQCETIVLGYPTAENDLYPFPHATSATWRLCNFVSRIPRLRRQEGFLWLRSLRSRLAGCDVVHIYNRPQWVALLRHLEYRGRIILYLQNNHLGDWTGPMLDALAPQLDLVAVCSSFLRETFTPRSAAIAAKTRLIYNGANTETFYPNESIREPATILFVGRFDREKGVLQLVQAYARVLDRYPQARLVICGGSNFGVGEETSYVRQVRNAASQLAIEKNARIQFTGYLHHDRELPSWFQRATIFCCPSLFPEPFGLVNAEAMACATPVAGSNRGGIPEVLGHTGRVYDPENTEQFADVLCRILAEPGYRAKLGTAAHQRCKEMFDWRVIAQQWGGLLADIATLPRIPYS
jgi:glycosyltransferase involved in cell wall biosynthesis